MQYLLDFRMLDPKRTSYQTLLALTYLSERRVIHGGASCHVQLLWRYFFTHLFSKDLHADNILFYFPGLVELTAQVWMDILEDPELIPVIPRNFKDQSDSLPKYLVETADITSVVRSVMSKHGKDDVYAVVADFGSGESSNQKGYKKKMGLVHHFYSIPCDGYY